MKNTKKGFTLIELIVVIAIIGVLAAILIPAMLGYVKKSKVTAANSSAASLYDAINTVLTELDEEGYDTGLIKNISYTKGQTSVTLGGTGTSTGKPSGTDFYNSIKEYFNEVNKVNFQAQCEGGICIAVAAASDSTYTGTKPSIVTKKNYGKYSAANTTALKTALDEAVKKSGSSTSTGTGTGSGT